MTSNSYMLGCFLKVEEMRNVSYYPVFLQCLIDCLAVGLSCLVSGILNTIFVFFEGFNTSFDPAYTLDASIHVHFFAFLYFVQLNLSSVRYTKFLITQPNTFSRYRGIPCGSSKNFSTVTQLYFLKSRFNTGDTVRTTGCCHRNCRCTPVTASWIKKFSLVVIAKAADTTDFIWGTIGDHRWNAIDCQRGYQRLLLSINKPVAS